MIVYFDQGKRTEFFKLWNDNIIKQNVDQNFEGHRLELELNIHFAIFSYKENCKDVNFKAFIFLE